MSNITRRRAFTSIAAIPAIGTAALVPAMAAPFVTPRERVEAAIEELKSAMMALDPSISHFSHEYRGAEPAGGKQCRFYMTAYNW